ncbi:MAG TPA: ABC transporter ATP-binding protein [Halanaerobiales bacterium]|nr:ABC transporter ATP-binding protein [Halanaerobiales bacterium]
MPVLDSREDYNSNDYSYLNLLKKFYKNYIRKRKLKYFTIQILHIVGALFALVPPLILKRIIDEAIPSGKFSRVMELVVLGFFVYLVSNIIRYIRVYFGHKYAQYITRDMRNDLFHHYQDLSMSFHDNKKTGELMSRVIDDLNQLQEFVHHGPEAIITSVVLIIGTAVILLSMSVRLAIVSLLFTPILLTFARLMMKKMHKAFRRTRENKAEMNDKLEDSLAGIKVTKAFVNEEREMENFAAKNQQHTDTRIYAIKFMSLLFTGSRMLNAIGILGALGYGGYLTVIGEISVGTIVAFYGYLETFREPLLRLINMTEGLSRFYASVERFFAHISIAPEIKNNSGNRSTEGIRGETEFKDVHFTYEQERVLKGINLKAEVNETVALVGPSGAGKTTIVRLIPRLYDVDSGQLLIDGINVCDYDVKKLRNAMAMVMQEDFLFSTTIAENIAYGKASASFEEIVEAAKKANAHQFITEQLPDGYETQVGQRGLKLSGGQRQRISIARAFLKDPRILILDEATSSVDLETEKLIQEAINQVTHGRTTFIIAHRLATIVNADKIIFVEDGQIKEQGTHEELMSGDTNYNRFYSRQFETA